MNFMQPATIDLFALYNPEPVIDHQIVEDAKYLLENYCLCPSVFAQYSQYAFPCEASTGTVDLVK